MMRKKIRIRDGKNSDQISGINIPEIRKTAYLYLLFCMFRAYPSWRGGGSSHGPHPATAVQADRHERGAAHTLAQEQAVRHGRGTAHTVAQERGTAHTLAQERGTTHTLAQERPPLLTAATPRPRRRSYH
jgi:hypothetical protein